MNAPVTSPSPPSPGARPTVYLIMQPSVKGNGETPDLKNLSDYGDVRVLVNAGEYPTKQPKRCLRLIEKRLVDFDPRRDYLVWAGGDSLAAILTGVVLADRNWEAIQWLRYDRPRGPDGRRTDVGAKYVPTTVPLFSDE